MLTAEELTRRRHYVTATDVPQILGASPWGNAADVWYDKIHGKHWSGNAATDAGNVLEPAVVEWARRELGGIVAGDWRVHENGINACSLDAMTLDGEPVEAKTSGIVGPGTPHQWGEPYTDEIPPYYLLQVQAQLLVTGAKRAYVPALLGGRGFVMYMVWNNPRLIEAIRQASEHFWRDHVEAKVQPNNLPSLETLKHLRREPESVVSIPTHLVESYNNCKAVERLAVAQANAAKAILLGALGTAEAGDYTGGRVWYSEQTRKGSQVEESTFRVLRVKPTKKVKGKE